MRPRPSHPMYLRRHANYNLRNRKLRSLQPQPAQRRTLPVNHSSLTIINIDVHLKVSRSHERRLVATRTVKHSYKTRYFLLKNRLKSARVALDVTDRLSSRRCTLWLTICMIIGRLIYISSAAYHAGTYSVPNVSPKSVAFLCERTRRRNVKTVEPTLWLPLLQDTLLNLWWMLLSKQKEWRSKPLESSHRELFGCHAPSLDYCNVFACPYHLQVF